MVQEGNTPLHYAAGGGWNLGAPFRFKNSKGHTEIVSLLIDKGADINSKNNVSILTCYCYTII